MRPFLLCCLLTIVGHRFSGAAAPDPLPADLASVSIAATGTPTSPFALIHLFKQDGFKGYALVDARGGCTPTRSRSVRTGT